MAFVSLAQPAGKLLDFNQHAWFSYSGDHPVAGPWGVHFDGQWRRADLGTAWQQYQLRPGVNYAVSKSLLLTLGYVYTRGYPYGDYPPFSEAFPEHRIYQQALIRHSRENIRFQHRFRLEQRWVRYPTAARPRTRTYQNRVRYMFRAEIPLSKEADGSARWYVPVWDEIFIGIAPNYGARPFDHNRLFAGVGRAFSGARVEAGYMNQFLSQRGGRVYEWNNTLYVTVTSNVPLRRLVGR